MGLVSTWLSGIGLSHAIPAFKAAGIVTPAALAELDLAHYEALGVKDPADRRKLFYLVQRIKMAQEDDPVENTAQQEIDDIVSQTIGNSKTKLILDEDDSLDDEEYVEDEEEEEEEEVVEVVEKPRPTKQTRKSTTTRQSTKPNTRKSAAANRASAASEAITNSAKENKQVNKPVKANPPTSRARARGTSLPTAAPTRSAKQTRKVAPINEPKQDEGEPNDEDSGWEEESLIADDEASTSRRRSSRRLKEKQLRSVDSGSSIGDTGTEEELETATESDTQERKTTRPRGTSRSISGSSLGYSGDAEMTSTKKRQSSGRVRRTSTSDLDADDESSISAPVTRKSGMQPPRNRRYENSKLQNPTTRTGKQLSTIPSDSVAPMSPLTKMPVSRLDEDISQQQKVDRKKKTDAVSSAPAKTRQRLGRSLSFGDVTSSDTDQEPRSSSRKRGSSLSGSDTDVRGSSTRRSKSRLSAGQMPATSGSDTEVQNVARRRSRLSTGAKSGATSGSDTEGKTVRRTSSRSRTSTGGIAKRQASSSANSSGRKSVSVLELEKPKAAGAIFVHGTAEDNSWTGQVARLREDNESEHELFHGNLLDEDEEEMRIRVIVRKRPMSNSENSTAKEIDVIQPLDYGSHGRVLTYQAKTRVDLTRQVETIPFAYDNVFDEKCSNEDIYERTVSNLIPGVFEEGKWASVFAYGQTGSGKTFTMMGCNVTGIKAGTSKDNKANYGLYYMAALDVFAMANMKEFQHMSIGISLFEIYGGKLFDLLNGRKQVKCLEDHRGKVCFPGLSEHPVSNAYEVMQVIESGACNRSTGTTSKNADSSRSHAILQIHVRKTNGRKQNIEHGRLTFIDLAGSERGADTAKASRATRLEGAEINTSLLALKEVIRALATGDSMSHIPFRGSKLTQVLKESFVGDNCRSVMVACIAPNMSNCEHTLNTLRYADRVKERNPTSGALSASVSSIRGRASTTKRSSRQSIAKMSAKRAQAEAEEEEFQEVQDEEEEFQEEEEEFHEAEEDVQEPEEEFQEEEEFHEAEEEFQEAEEEFQEEEYQQEDEEEEYQLEEEEDEECRTEDKEEDEDDEAARFDESINVRSSFSPMSPESIMLDDLLESPPLKVPRSSRVSKMKPLSARRPQQSGTANDLISTHRTVMSDMLRMCKDEMTLANNADADRDSIDAYLEELGSIHEKQCLMLTTLHEKLLEYRGSHGRGLEEQVADDGVSDDDSFEDLRD